MNLPLSSLTTIFYRFRGASQGVRIEDRRWRRSLEALNRDVEGLRRRMGGHHGRWDDDEHGAADNLVLRFGERVS